MESTNHPVIRTGGNLMHTTDRALNIDPRIEDPDKLKPLSRRGFIGRLVGGVAGATAFLSMSPKSYGAPAEEMFDMAGGAPADDETYWEGVADQFLIRKGVSYMNTGTRGVSPRSVHQAQIEAVERVNSDPNMTWSTYFFPAMNEIREKMAAFVGANIDEIAFTNSTTDGMGLGFMGIELKRGDEILTTNYDYGWVKNMMKYRAKRDGLALKMVDISEPRFRTLENPQEVVKAVEAGITPRTRFLTICHINYTDGFVMPVKEICDLARAKGIITLVDGAQPPGMMKLDLHELGCDMYAAAGHKYMLAAQHTGFLYVREDAADRVQPLVYTGSPDSDMSGAGKLEQRGSSSYSDRIAMGAALDFHNHLTREAVEARLRYLTQRLIKGLKAVEGVTVYASDNPRNSCALVSFSIRDKKPSDIVASMWYGPSWNGPNTYLRTVSASGDFSAVRASLHVMVTAKQVDALIDMVGFMANG